MAELTQKEKNKLLAAAEIVENGDVAVLKKILEFGDEVENFKEKINQTVEEVGTVIEEAKTAISNLREIKDGEPGKDYVLTEEDKKEIAQSIQVPVVEKVIERTEIIKEQPVINNEIVKEIVHDMTESPEKIKEKILEAGIEISDINDLPKELEDIRNEIKKVTPIRGGGTSAIGVAHAFKYIAKTEQPTGAIDGINTTYYVKSDIWWIAGFTLNGEQIAELPNFTYSGKTITFSTALPAAYSGKDWEIKYIGT